MSTDYEDKEREFLSYLKADTGRDLAEWMVAITEAGLAHRNDVIDWLRRQGFIFARASWLQRIHHGGGRPIYLSEVPPNLERHQRAPGAERPSAKTPAKPPSQPPPSTGAPASPARLSPVPSRPVLVYTAPVPQKPRELDQTRTPEHSPPMPSARPPSAGPAKPVPEAAEPVRPKPFQQESTKPADVKPQTHPAPVPGSTGLSPDVSALVAKAKAYAPLAGFILRSLSDALPGTVLQATGNYISCNRPETFAILVPGSRDIKLGVSLEAAPFEREIVTARFTNLSPAPPKAITHMVVLTDARQIDKALMDLLRSANTNVNG